MGGFDFTQRCKDHVEIHQVNALAYLTCCRRSLLNKALEGSRNKKLF